MNRVAAAKAVGWYLLIVGSLVGYIVGIVWAFTTNQGDLVKGLSISAPGVIFIAGVAVWLPISSMYDYYNQGS